MLSAVAFIALMLCLLLYPGAVQSSVASSVTYCLTVLVPSLFPFMALTSYAVSSRAAVTLGRPLDLVTRHVFKLPGCCAVPVLMSLIGGYPAGAKGASLLLSEGRITGPQAGRMLLFCVNPGLAFTVTYLGLGVFGSTGIGWRLFLSVTIPAILMGVLTGLRAPVPQKQEEHGGVPGGSQALTRSVADASKSVLIMCACIVLFAGFTAVLHAGGIFQQAVKMLTRVGIFTPQQWAASLSFLLEVTGGTGDARALGVGAGFFAFGLAFGGLCVHIQVFSLFRELPVKLPVFFLCRFIHGLLAAVCFELLGKIMPGGAVETMAGAYKAALSPGGWMGGASLLLMCAAFLLIAGGRAGRGCQNGD